MGRRRHPRLAWRTTVQGLGDKGQPHGEVFVTDATTGAAIENYDVEREATGTGHSEYTGDITIDTTQQADGTFALIDPTRKHITKDARNVSSSSLNSSSGTLFTDADNIWGDGRKFSTDRSTAAVDAHANTAKTYDYYKNTFGRNGIKNDGRGATVFVHVGTKWDNAQWSDACFCMMTGDGDGTTDPEQVDLDTMGHEMTHGVTSATANLRYSGESGGLNEATSDILGTMVEWYANNPLDTPDYLFSDQSTPPWLRRFDKPSLDGHSADYWSKSVGQAGRAQLLGRRQPLVLPRQRGQRRQDDQRHHLQQPDVQRLHRHRHRQPEGLRHLVPGADRLHDLHHGLQGRPHRDPERGEGPLRRNQPRVRHRGCGLERGQRPLTHRRTA